MQNMKNQKRTQGGLVNCNRKSIQTLKSKQSTSNNSTLSKYFKEPLDSSTSNHLSSQHVESPYKNSLTDIKRISLNDGSDDFQSPQTIKKPRKIFPNKLKQTKLRQSNVKNVVVKCTEDNFKNVDVNPEHLQMAIALSKSTFESENPQLAKENEKDLPDVSSPIKCRGDLERFVFKSTRNRRAPDCSRTNSFEIRRKQRNSKFRFITPVLYTRSSEDREFLITTKISSILQQKKAPCEKNKITDNFKISSSYLQELCCKDLKITKFNAYSYEEIKNSKYIVLDLNISQADKSSYGCLLKKWEDIPGREKSPLKEQFDSDSLTNIPSTSPEKETKLADNLQKQNRCSSPDLFDSFNSDSELWSPIKDNHNSAFKTYLGNSGIEHFEVFEESSKKACPLKSSSEETDAECGNNIESIVNNGGNEHNTSIECNADKGSVIEEDVPKEYLEINDTLDNSTHNSSEQHIEDNVIISENCSTLPSVQSNHDCEIEMQNDPNIDIKNQGDDMDSKICSETLNESNNICDELNIKQSSLSIQPDEVIRTSIDKFISRPTSLNSTEILNVTDYVTNMLSKSNSWLEKKNTTKDEKEKEVFHLQQISNSQESIIISDEEISHSNAGSKTNRNKNFYSLSDFEESDTDDYNVIEENLRYVDSETQKYKNNDHLNERSNLHTKESNFLEIHKNQTRKENVDIELNEGTISDEELNPSSLHSNEDVSRNKKQEENEDIQLSQESNVISDEELNYSSIHSNDNRHVSNLEVSKNKNQKENEEIQLSQESIVISDEELNYSSMHSNDNRYVSNLDVSENKKQEENEDIQLSQESLLISDEELNYSSMNSNDNRYVSNSEISKNEKEENEDIPLSQESIIISDEELNYSSLHSKDNRNFYNLTNFDETITNIEGSNNIENENLTDILSGLKIKYTQEKISENVEIPIVDKPITEQQMCSDDHVQEIDDEIALNDSLNSILKNESFPANLDEEKFTITSDKIVLTPTKNKETENQKSTSNQNLFTATNDVIIKTKNVTPMRNYDEMDTPSIQEELDTFGIRPLKRRRGVQLLKHIYECTHPIVGSELSHLNFEDDEENRLIKRRKKCSEIGIEPARAELNSKSEEDNRIINRQKKNIENNLIQLCEYNRNLSKQYRIIGDDLLQNEKLEDLIFERKYSKKISSCALPLQIGWYNFVSVNPELHEHILCYEPLHLEVIHMMLNEQSESKFHIQDLITFLDRKCITFRTSRVQKETLKA